MQKLLTYQNRNTVFEITEDIEKEAEKRGMDIKQVALSSYYNAFDYRTYFHAIAVLEKPEDEGDEIDD